MCTVCKMRPKVFRALEDIPIYKAVFKESNSYITPFRFTPITKTMIPEKLTTFPTPMFVSGEPRLLVGEGFIHSFLTFVGDKTYILNGHILLRGYIPKGTEYLISCDGHSICSRKVILYL